MYSIVISSDSVKVKYLWKIYLQMKTNPDIRQGFPIHRHPSSYFRQPRFQGKIDGSLSKNPRDQGPLQSSKIYPLIFFYYVILNAFSTRFLKFKSSQNRSWSLIWFFAKFFKIHYLNKSWLFVRISHPTKNSDPRDIPKMKNPESWG